MQAGAGETITFSATASADYAVHSWTGVKVSPPTGTTATLTVTANTEVTVKFYETTFDGSSYPAEAWKKLKERIAAAPSGGTLKISGTIQSTSASGNSGEIIIDKDLTIEAPSVTATLDANSNHSGPPPADAPATKHRIFHVKDGKTLTLKNLTLKNGAVENGVVGSLGTTGGGIRIENGTVLLSDVIISGCKAITAGRHNEQGMYEGFHGNGAGIYVESGTVTMENTTLSANIADAYGGAVYLKGGTLTMKGSTVVTPSTGSDANKTGKNDVRLVEGAKIIVDGALTGSVPVARITVAYNEYLPTRQVLDGRAVVSNNTKFTVTDQELGTGNGGVHVRKWNIKSDGYLQSEEVTLDGSKIRAWQALKDAVHTASDGDVIAIDGTIKATNLGLGDYVDNGEIVVTKNITIKAKSGTATLDADNETGGKPAHRIFKVDGATATLTLENLTLKNGYAKTAGDALGGGISVINGGKVTLKNTTISACTASYGGAVTVDGTSSSVTMESGSLTANTATTIGGAVNVDNGASFTMTGGTINGNIGKSGGGGAYVHEGTFTLGTGASIESNTAEGRNGGGVYVDSGGTLAIDGGAVKSNEASKSGSAVGNGGGVYVFGSTASKGKVRMTAGEISGNTAGFDGTAYKGDGGGVYSEGGTVEISGGEIKSNTAKYGGGIYVKGAGATLTMSGGKISANKAVVDGTNGGAGGGIFIGTGAKLTISGGTVGGSSDAEGNSATIGGGIYMMDNGAKAKMTVGSITHNKADKSGGGITAFGDFNMDGGSIEENTATGDPDPSLNLGTGGGIDLVAATMNMTGGEIKNNRAKRSGGGVSLGLSGTRDAVFNMSGGTISGNTFTGTSGKGAGVEFFTESTTHGSTTYYTRMKMSGSAKVHTNNDVYLNNSRMITVDGTLTPAGGIAACLTPETYAAGRQVLEAGTGINLANEAGKFTVTPQTSPAKKWTIDEQGNLQGITGGSASSATAKWTALKTAVAANTTQDAVFYIEGEYTMSSGSDTIEPNVSCTIRGTNNAVLNGNSKGTMINIGYSRNITLENLKIQNGKNESFALSASFGSEVYLKNVTVSNTKKIVKSNSGDVTFENVEALDTDSAIELGGGNSGSGEVEYSYLKIKGDTNFKGTVKLSFPYNGNDYSSAVKICDKKSYTLKLDFDGYYDKAENQQVVFLDPSVTGFTLADAVKNITVKSSGGFQWYIDDNGYLKKR